MVIHCIFLKVYYTHFYKLKQHFLLKATQEN